jgi:putrescine transport system permease protein
VTVAPTAIVAAPAARDGPGRAGWRQWLDRDGWRQLMIAVPYLWLVVFFVAPFLIVLAISFGISQVGIPPVVWPERFPFLAMDNYRLLVSKSLYLRAYLNSIEMAAIATAITLLIGFPMALAIARSSGAMRNVLLLLVILPFWTSFLLRVYAWIGLLGSSSWLNRGLTWMVNHFFPVWGEIDKIQMMNTDFAVILGIVYSYLPFMILPLYATLERLDPALDEAAMDLGSRRWQVFRDITLPLALPGILAGSMLVFIPASGEYVIPALLGRGDSPMIGRVLVDEFFQNRSWPVASAVAVALLFMLVIPIMLYNYIESRSLRGAST